MEDVADVFTDLPLDFEEPADEILEAEAPGMPGEAPGMPGVEYTGKPSIDSEREFSEVLRQFRARDSREKDRLADADDCEYFVVLVFQVRAQREAFVASVGEDGPDHQYLDGLRVAEKLGVEIPPADRSWSPGRVDAAFRDYAI